MGIYLQWQQQKTSLNHLGPAVWGQLKQSHTERHSQIFNSRLNEANEEERESQLDLAGFVPWWVRGCGRIQGGSWCPCRCSQEWWCSVEKQASSLRPFHPSWQVWLKMLPLNTWKYFSFLLTTFQTLVRVTFVILPSNLSLQLSEVFLQLLLLRLHLLLRTAVDQVIEEEACLVWNQVKTPNFDQLSWEHVSTGLSVSHICGFFVFFSCGVGVCGPAADGGCFWAGVWVNVRWSVLTAPPPHTQTSTLTQTHVQMLSNGMWHG